MSKESLINRALELHEEINSLAIDYRFESLLSLDLSIGQMKSLLYLYSRHKASHRELAEVLNVAPPVVTGIIDRLASQGMVARTTSPEDRRIHLLTLTEKGRGVFDLIRQKSSREAGVILGRLSEEDLAALVQGFSSLLSATRRHLEETGRVMEPGEQRV